jgi:hydroxyacylglutathione hydrolase
MKLIPLPAFEDNYIWMLHNGQHALVVDPGDAIPVTLALQREGVELQAILVTHHHGDHTGGVQALRELTGASVYGPRTEDIPHPFMPLGEGDVLHTLGLELDVMDVPGHTAGHIAYVCHQSGDTPDLLFCGDTLFSGGCGRLFEGTPEQMLDSLTRLAALPLDTRVCCTHEYTMSNLAFATAIEPDNAELKEYRQRCQALRNALLPTLPSTIEQERKINPFLRSCEPQVIAAALKHDAVSVDKVGVFATLRQWKNGYR